MIDAATRARVVARARQACEYCLLPQSAYDLTFNIDHVVARQHRGRDDESNLALACPRCNRKKGTKLSAVDPQSRDPVALYHPRRDKWADHFRLIGATITGITPVGRATVLLLDMNAPDRISLRTSLIAAGEFQPRTD